MGNRLISGRSKRHEIERVAPATVEFESELRPDETATRTRRFRLLSCGYCGETELKRLHRNFWQRRFSFLCVFPYRCRSCTEEQFRLLPSLRLLVPLLLIIGLGSWYVHVVAAYQSLAAEQAVAAKKRKAWIVDFRAHGAAAQMSPAQSLSAAERNQILRNEDVVRMAATSRDRRYVVARVQYSLGVYDLSAGGIEKLKQAGVDQSVIAAMILRTAQLTAVGGQWMP